MTPKYDAQKVLEKMKEIYGEEVVDPDVFPRIFDFQVKMAQYELEQESRNEQRTT